MSKRVFATALITILGISFCSSSADASPASAAPRRPPDVPRRSPHGRARGGPSGLAGRAARGLRAHDDRPRRRKAQRGRLDRARRRLGPAPPAHAEREDRRHAALLAGRKDARFHLRPRRRAAGVSARSLGRRAAQADGPRGGRAGAARLLARREEAGVRVRRVSGLRRTKPATGRGARRPRRTPSRSITSRACMYRHWDEWRENVRHHVFVADVATGAVDGRDAGRLRLAADAITRKAASPSRRTARRSRSSRTATATTRRRSRRTRTSSSCPSAGGAAEKLTAGTRRRTSSPSFTPDGASILVRAQRRPTFEGGPLVPRRLRPEDEGETDALREPGPLGRASSSCRRTARPSTSRQTREGQKRSLRSVARGGHAPRDLEKGGDIGALRAGPGFLVFTENSLTAPSEIFLLPLDEKSPSPAAKSQQAKAPPIAR